MKLITLLLVFYLLPSIVAAQTVYVTDQLSLKLRQTPASDGAVIVTLKSGDKLTLLEKRNGFSKVKTEEGKSGWVQSWYVSPDEPASYFLDKANQENEQLKQQLEKANKKIDNYSSELLTENNELKNTVATLSEKIKALTNEQDMLHEKMSTQAKNLAKYEFADKYNINLIILVFFLVSFALGFFVALRWIRRQESKRLSGYKLAHK
jgi:SH3 domain protein